MPGSESVIVSRRNPWFRRLRRAIERHDDEIVVEGPRAIGDALQAGWRPVVVAARVGVDCSSLSIRPLRLERDLFRELAGTAHSQGLVALFPRPAGSPGTILGSNDRMIVALDGVQDPGNVGTIIRLAASFDAAGVILLEGCADPWSSKVIRSSAGTVLRVAVAPMERTALLAAADRGGIPVYAAVAHVASPVTIVPSRAVLVLGSEGEGVSRAILDRATPVSIPMSNAVESLNVAAAAAILLAKSYESRNR